MIKSADIGPEDVKTAMEAEAEDQQAMSKKARQHRRFELSNPATISPRLTAVLAERFSPDVIADKIEALLSATMLDKQGNERPDIRAMEAGLRFALHYTAGTPVQRQEVITHSPDKTIGEFRDLVNGSPALQQELKRRREELAELIAFEEGRLKHQG